MSRTYRVDEESRRYTGRHRRNAFKRVEDMRTGFFREDPVSNEDMTIYVEVAQAAKFQNILY